MRFSAAAWRSARGLSPAVPRHPPPWPLPSTNRTGRFRLPLPGRLLQIYKHQCGLETERAVVRLLRPRRTESATIDDGSRTASLSTSMSIAEAPTCSLLTPIQRSVPQHLGEPEPLRLLPVKDRLDDIRRQACQRQEPADVGVRDALLLREVGDRLGLTALDPPPPAMRADERLDQGLIPRWLAGRLPPPPVS